MKKNFLLFSLPVLAIPLLPALGSWHNFSNVKIEQNSIACKEQAISSLYASGNVSIIDGVNPNANIKYKIEQNMYHWELHSLLEYESSGNLRFFDSTLSKNLWNVPDGKLSNNAVISSYYMNKKADGNYEASIQVKDGSTYWQFPTVIFKPFENKQEPTTFLIRDNSLKEFIPSDIVSTVFTSGYQIKKNIYCNIPNGISFYGVNLKIIDYHDKNSEVSMLYPKNINYEQPTTNFSVVSSENQDGSITLNVNFSGGSSFKNESNPNRFNPFRIAYFDSNGEPVRFQGDGGSSLSGINQQFNLSGFKKKTNTLSIFSGDDGQFLMYELIGVSVVLFLTILYTIIHISRRNKRLSSVRRVETRR